MTTMTRLRAGRWQLDPATATAAFTVRAMFGVPAHGHVPVTSASVDVDAAGRPVAVRAELDLSAVDTGNARRDRDLRKPSLLDLDRHPTLVFTAGAPVPDGERWTATGTVTARGRQAPITLAVHVDSDGELVRVVARGVLDRGPLGLRAPRFMIGGRVKVHVEAAFRAP